MSDVPSQAIFDAVLATDMIPSKDKLRALAEGASRLAAIEKEMSDLEKKSKELEKEYKELSRRRLPELFDEVHLDRIGVPDAMVDLVVEAKYFANIPVDWPEEQRSAAFDLIEEFGGGDMVSTTVSVSFGKGETRLAEQLQQRLQGLNWLQGRPVVMKKGVHWGTFSSWLREHYQNEDIKKKIPLEPINGDVGRVCKLKARKVTSKKGR